MYELCFRAKASLPLVAYECLNFIIHCVLARAQRDEKVILCHDLWNGSHPHIIVVTRDAQQLVNFYCEVQKKVTDILKRLLGLDHLQLWDGRPSVIKVGDIDAAIERISYLYANPAQDNLEDCIEAFPGASSWKDFQRCERSLNAKAETKCPWIRLPSVPRLSSDILSPEEDYDVIKQLKASNKKFHTLIRQPNAWMRCFGIRNPGEINDRIIIRIRSREAYARELRIDEQKNVLGAARLKNQKILQSHTPPKREKRIFIITTVNEIRLEFIDRMKKFQSLCRKCLARWKAGEFSVEWPPEAFKPPLPPRINLLAT